MPNSPKTTELVQAIERVILEACGRIETADIVDRVAERLTPGVPPVKRREENPNALIYDTITKELAYVTGQDKRGRRREPSPLPQVDCQGLQRRVLGQLGNTPVGPVAHGSRVRG